MPTAADYRDAARRFRTQAAWLHRAADDVPAAADVLGWAGPVADHHSESMGSIRWELQRAVDELADLAGLCERRAAVCADYAAAVARYERLEWWQRAITSRPAQPAAWAEPA